MTIIVILGSVLFLHVDDIVSETRHAYARSKKAMLRDANTSFRSLVAHQSQQANTAA
jgi:hypothetical protein